MKMNLLEKIQLIVTCLLLIRPHTNALKLDNNSSNSSSSSSSGSSSSNPNSNSDIDKTDRMEIPLHLTDLPTKFGDEDDIVKITPNKHHTDRFNSNHHYDDDDDEDDGDYHDRSENIDSEYEEEEEEDDDDDGDDGGSLDHFDPKILIDDKNDNAMPIFLIEPKSGYIVRNRPVTLECKAVHALEVSFRCSGSSQSPPSKKDSHVDPHSGAHVQEVTATISRDFVEEYFGKVFKCECYAWSSRGKVKSQSATIEVAHLKKNFAIQPSPIHIELGGRAELQCSPPNGVPIPKITWLRNGMPINLDDSPSILTTIDGNLIITRVAFKDIGNYTCVAENTAARRASDAVSLTVFVNGRWSNWSEWSTCSYDCLQTRRRSCVSTSPHFTDYPDSVKCVGRDFQSSECRGGRCKILIHHPETIETPKKGIDWPFYATLVIIFAVCIAFGGIISYIASKRNQLVPYRGTKTEILTANTLNGKPISYEVVPVRTVVTDKNFSSYPYRKTCSNDEFIFTNSARPSSEHVYDEPHITANYNYQLANQNLQRVDRVSIDDSCSSSHYSRSYYSSSSCGTHGSQTNQPPNQPNNMNVNLT